MADCVERLVTNHEKTRGKVPDSIGNREARSPHGGVHLHLVAHGMGNYALRDAFQAIRADMAGKAPRLFDRVFLMTADEDIDAFVDDGKFTHLHDLVHSVQACFVQKNGAPSISDTTKMHPDRAATTGPRGLSNLRQKVILADSSNVSPTISVSEANDPCHRQRMEAIADAEAVCSGQVSDKIANRDFVPDKRAFRIRAK